jgi:hypothetical protein
MNAGMANTVPVYRHTYAFDHSLLSTHNHARIHIGEHRPNFFLHARALISTIKGEKAKKVESRKVEGLSRKSGRSHLSQKLKKGVKSAKVQKSTVKKLKSQEST